MEYMTTPITKEVRRTKSSRKLRPELRLLIEEKLFINGEIPRCFLQKDIPECAIAVAEAIESLGIRERGGQNKGEIVGYIQGVVGGYIPMGNGDPWCLSTVQCIVAFIEDYFQQESPFPATESVMNCFSAAKKIDGLVAEECEPGAVFLAQQGDRWMGHAGVVIEVISDDKMRTIEGNTGHSSIRDGDGVYLRERNQKENGPLKTRAFVRIFPNNQLKESV